MQDLALKYESEIPREKIELIKQTVAKGATDLELELFFHACRRTGLDPLMKQIYAIKRWNSQENRNQMSFQTGIDGYRLIADRTGCYAGSSDAEYLIGEEGYPDVAKVTVTKLVSGQPCQFTSSARWREYCQFGRDGQPTSMWKKMPFLMLAKCAEALALRKAFPAELSGLYTHEEMSQADEPRAAAYTSQKTTAARKLAELRAEGIAEQDGAATDVDSDMRSTPVAPQQGSDAAPRFNPEVPPPADAPTSPTLHAGNVAQQFRLCESIAQCAQVANAWQEESHLHTPEERVQVKKAFDEARKRLGRR